MDRDVFLCYYQGLFCRGCEETLLIRRLECFCCHIWESACVPLHYAWAGSYTSLNTENGSLHRNKQNPCNVRQSVWENTLTSAGWGCVLESSTKLCLVDVTAAISHVLILCTLLCDLWVALWKTRTVGHNLWAGWTLQVSKWPNKSWEAPISEAITQTLEIIVKTCPYFSGFLLSSAD